MSVYEILRRDAEVRPFTPSVLRRLRPFEESAYAVNLQFFAAEDEGRTEEPTEHKIRKAREEGKVARSADLTSSLTLLFTVLTIGIFGSYFLRTAVEMMGWFIQAVGEIDVTTTMVFVPVFFSYFLKLALPILVVAFVTSLAGTLIQVGFLFTTKPITPDITRIAPRFGKFFQRALFSAEGLFNLGKSLFKVAVVGAIAYLNFSMELGRIANLVRVSIAQGFLFLAELTFRILVEASIVFILISIIDYMFARFQYRQSLMMTRQEIKEERKMYEGDPLVRSRLRERMREILSRNMMRNVPRADVVITNPTHFAVVLEWNRETMPAPTVTAKGQDLMAQRIREIATEHSVPIVENRPLARTLYAEVEIGDTIPEKYYQVVAAVLAEVYRLEGGVRDAARVREAGDA